MLKIEGLAMRKAVFWLLTVVLLTVLGASSLLWFRSFHYSEQAVLRWGTPSVAVLTTDRGRWSVLFLAHQRMDGQNWIARWRVNPKLDKAAPRLDQLCEDSAIGFGMDQEVMVEGPELPAVAGVSTSNWAVQRLVVPFWALFFGSIGGLIVCWAVLGKRIYRIEHGLCAKCAYDVSQCSHFCPHCGKPIPRKTWSGDTRPVKPGRPATTPSPTA